MIVTNVIGENCFLVIHQVPHVTKYCNTCKQSDFFFNVCLNMSNIVGITLIQVTELLLYNKIMLYSVLVDIKKKLILINI